MTAPWSRRKRRLQGGSERGAALIELAVSLPLLAVILVGTIDFARAFFMSIELMDAARAGAQYGAISDIQAFDSAGILAATLSASPRLSLVAGDVTLQSPSAVCRCAANDGSSFPTTVVACDGSTCTSSQHIIMTVTVKVTKTFSRLSGFPGIPRTMVISRSAILRVSPS